MNVRLVQITPDPERTMIYIARVSNPANQDNPEIERLLSYCLRNGHWSVFEHAYMTLEVETSLAVATQILRHRSFVFQQLSRRFNGDTPTFELVRLRRQAAKNRQSSTDDLPEWTAERLQDRIRDLQFEIVELYEDMIANGVARECARMILPQCTRTRLYMTGNCRSWIHYLQQRTAPDTQAEHREVALAAQAIFCEQFPVTAAALGWTSIICRQC